MLKSNRDKSNFIVTLVLWWYQSNKSVVKLVSLFFQILICSGFPVSPKSSSTVVHWGDSKESAVEKSGILGTFILVSGRNDRTTGRGASPPPVSAGLGCLGGSLPLWSGKLPTIRGCHRRRCRRYHHDQHQHCCQWHQFLVLFSETIHS